MGSFRATLGSRTGERLGCFSLAFLQLCHHLHGFSLQTVKPEDNSHCCFSAGRVSPGLHLPTVLVNLFSEVKLYCNTFLTADFHFIRVKDVLRISSESTVVLAAFPAAGPTSTTQLSKPRKTPKRRKQSQRTESMPVWGCHLPGRSISALCDIPHGYTSLKQNIIKSKNFLISVLYNVKNTTCKMCRII